MSEHITAIVLSAGRGSRMESVIPKQYLSVCGRAIISYCLDQFEKCEEIDEVILVTSEEDMTYCRKEIAEKEGFRKITRIVPGGAERYDSVYRGLCAAEGADYVLIHDGARPFADAGILDRILQGVRTWKACAAGMPVKDTIKECDSEGKVLRTPDRKNLWTVQTPQAFARELIFEAYTRMYATLDNLQRHQITDDAMVVEKMMDHPVHMIQGSYRNLKITTPEDLIVMEAYIRTAHSWS